MSKIGKYERNKGMRFEREFAKATGGYRVPLSGAMGGEYTGDVKALGLTFECKIRKNGFQKIYDWLEGADALAIKADRKKTLTVVPLDTLLKIYSENQSPCEKDLIREAVDLKMRITDLENALNNQYDPLSYGKRIQKIRNLREKTVAQVAEVAHVTHEIVHDWENNVSRPTLEELIVVAKFLNTSTRYIELGLIEPGESRKERKGA